jgi:hypothetical protein
VLVVPILVGSPVVGTFNVDLSCVVQSWNAAAEHTLGRSAEETVGYYAPMIPVKYSWNCFFGLRGGARLSPWVADGEYALRRRRACRAGGCRATVARRA